MRVNHRVFIIVALCIVAVSASVPRPGLTVRIIDVGQGDAALIQCGARQMLVDGGPDRSVLAGLGRGMPAFDRDIDLAVLTHPHADHYLGLIGVMERYRVRRLLTSGAHSDAAEYAALLRAADAEGVRPEPLRVGDHITLGECAVIDVLWPDADAPDAADPNESSVVLRVRRADAASRTAAVLLTGDATDDVERALLASGADLAADVLKVGHHGSQTSSTGEFLDAVAPTDAVISVGRNSYGHPAMAAVMRLAKRGIRTYRTDRDGDVVVRIGRDRASVRGKPGPPKAFTGY